MPHVMTLSQEVGRDPYAHLLSQSELQSAKNLPMRLLAHTVTFGATAFYYLSRHNELGRIRAGKFSIDMVFGVAWRCAFSAVVCDQVSRRLFVNYAQLRNHKIADYEIRKVMRFMPNPRPHTPVHRRPNSYVMV